MESHLKREYITVFSAKWIAVNNRKYYAGFQMFVLYVVADECSTNLFTIETSQRTIGRENLQKQGSALPIKV